MSTARHISLVMRFASSFLAVGLGAGTMMAAEPPAGASSPKPSQARAASNSIGLRLLDEPASASSDPRARIYIVDHLAPATTIHRRIEIFNTTTTTLPAILYPGAAFVSDGSFVGAEGHTQ